MFEKRKIVSEFDGLELELEMIVPESNPIGIVQLSHGMAEHKERYEEFMEYLASKGYIAVINDHRGHGASVKSKEDLGYFYTDDCEGIVEDLYQVTKLMKAEHPNLPVYLFSHSMGTLVARKYLKKHDQEIEKLVLCGPPTENPATRLAIILTKISMIFKGKQHRNRFIHNLAFAGNNKGYDKENAWLSRNLESVDRYNADELCGFVFTNNGFLNLFCLMKESFSKSGWQMKHPTLLIFIIAGEKDPVIQGEKKFYALKEFLENIGYKNIKTKLYEQNRHEILNEDNRADIYRDIVDFL